MSNKFLLIAAQSGNLSDKTKAIRYFTFNTFNEATIYYNNNLQNILPYCDIVCLADANNFKWGKCKLCLNEIEITMTVDDKNLCFNCCNAISCKMIYKTTCLLCEEDKVGGYDINKKFICSSCIELTQRKFELQKKNSQKNQ